ncbi:MAG TPA: sigma-54-dependent Fis family transcriptional regulator [Desulfobulbus sp.]|nr:sigma-54-dependent Fis family transcriptional regulator [Desulfobulbus sp.]
MPASAHRSLTSREHTLLQRVSDAISANPFTRQRREADSRITGLAPDTGSQALLAAVTDKVQRQVQRFARQGRATVTGFQGRERQLVADLFVFHVFHRHLERLDRHIREQNQTTSPCPLTCGDDILRELAGFGFTEAAAERYLALFFQMRRAFFFISTSLIGVSPSMHELRARLWNNIFGHDIRVYAGLLWDRLEDFSTLLLGETGTGKGLVAAATGRSGFIPYDRRTKKFRASFTEAFLAINLSQYPEQLIESELFGHARGAFTGAVQPHRGIFSRSSPFGAVFLDEIGEVPIPVQVKLLRVLQERTFTPVGSYRQERFAGRIIAATNRDLARLRRQGRFREDFYYRLCSDVITIAPLRRRIRECPQELDLLATHLLKKIAGDSGELEERVLEALHRDLPPDHDWPGNVRELEQCIRRILLHGSCSPDDRTDREDLPLAVRIADGDLSVAELTARYCRQLYRLHGSYQEVARRTGLDRRTVKKYLQRDEASQPAGRQKSISPGKKKENR